MWTLWFPPAFNGCCVLCIPSTFFFSCWRQVLFFKIPESSLLAIPPTELNFYFSCWRQVLFLKNLESSLLAIPPTEQTFFFFPVALAPCARLLPRAFLVFSCFLGSLCCETIIMPTHPPLSCLSKKSYCPLGTKKNNMRFLVSSLLLSCFLLCALRLVPWSWRIAVACFSFVFPWEFHDSLCLACSGAGSLCSWLSLVLRREVDDSLCVACRCAVIRCTWLSLGVGPEVYDSLHLSFLGFWDQ